MIKIANIIPTDYLSHLLLDSPSQIHLLLAHQVLQDEKYVEFYLKRKAKGDYLILDNSAFEFGGAISADLLEKAINIIQPNEFVLPDVLFDKDQTIARSSEFAKEVNIESLRYMGVVQGKTLDEWLSCYKYFSESKYIYSLGLGAVYSPKTVFNNTESNDLVSGREFLIIKLKENNLLTLNKPHHLLGLGDSGQLEIQKMKTTQFIRSADSSAAFIHGINGLKISKDKPYIKIREKIDFSQPYTTKNIDLITENIQLLNEMAQ